jgi:hypothetical protein
MKKNKGVFIFLLLIFLLIIGHSSYSLFKIVNDSNVDKNNHVYTNKGKVTYFVTLEDNDFISSKILGSGGTYITDLTNKISMTMEYEYSSENPLPIEEDHGITATIYGLYNENPNSTRNPIIWEKPYIIKSNTKETYTSKNTIKVVETFDIDLSIYNAEADRFKTTFSIPTISYLEIVMPVNIISNTDDYELKENYKLTAKIPLTEKVFNIETSENDSAEKLLPSKNVIEVNIDQRKVTIYLVLIFGSIVLAGLTIRKLMDNPEHEEFHNLLDGLKKEFNEIIVETDNMVDARTLKPIVITTFDEMLNLATSLEMPIILYEESNLAVFYIVKGEIIYSYLVKKEKKVK